MYVPIYVAAVVILAKRVLVMRSLINVPWTLEDFQFSSVLLCGTNIPLTNILSLVISSNVLRLLLTFNCKRKVNTIRDVPLFRYFKEDPVGEMVTLAALFNESRVRCTVRTLVIRTPTWNSRFHRFLLAIRTTIIIKGVIPGKCLDGTCYLALAWLPSNILCPTLGCLKAIK